MYLRIMVSFVVIVLTGSSALGLDVRRLDERAQGFIPGSSYIPLDELRGCLNELPRD